MFNFDTCGDKGSYLAPGPLSLVREVPETTCRRLSCFRCRSGRFGKEKDPFFLARKQITIRRLSANGLVTVLTVG